MRNCLILFILSGVIEHVISWRRENYYPKNVDDNEKNTNDFILTEKDHFNHNYYDYYGSFEHEDDGNYEDRIVFPDTKVDFQKKWRTSTTQNPIRNVLVCITECSNEDAYDPVCGTNDVTYYNLNRLECAAKCGVDVRLRHLSNCGRIEEPPSTSPPVIRSDSLKTCMWSCPTSNEYNPICGTDNITYYNPGKLACAQRCGVDVQFKRHYPCPKANHDNEEPVTTSTARSTTAKTITTGRPSQLSRETVLCIHSCPSTSEYNPVCGSNGQTYNNAAKLDCARYCGVDVTLVRNSSCVVSIPTSTLPVDNRVFIETTTTSRPTISQELLDQIFKREDDEDDEYGEDQINVRIHR